MTTLNDNPPAPVSAATPAADRVAHGGAVPGSADNSLDSAALLQGGRAVAIRHNGEVYRLQTTRQGKLILTK